MTNCDGYAGYGMMINPAVLQPADHAAPPHCSTGAAVHCTQTCGHDVIKCAPDDTSPSLAPHGTLLPTVGRLSW